MGAESRQPTAHCHLKYKGAACIGAEHAIRMPHATDIIKDKVASRHQNAASLTVPPEGELYAIIIASTHGGVNGEAQSLTDIYLTKHVLRRRRPIVILMK